MILHCISVIEKSVPNARLEFKYGVPYFYLNKKPFCYFTTNHKNEFVDIGFAKGFQLKRNQAVLVFENRNTVKSLRYFSLEEIDNEVLIDILNEAFELY